MTVITQLRVAGSACTASARLFLRDVGAGLLDVSHNSLALLGLCVVGVAVFAGGREELRTLAERHALDWLQARQEAREPDPTTACPSPSPNRRR